MRLVKRFVTGPISICNYLVEHNKEYMLIDCGLMDDVVLNYLKENEIDLKYILITHSHCDHIEGIDVIKNLYPNVKVVISDEERAFLRDTELNLSNYTPYKVDIKTNALTYEDISIPDLEFKYVRGHSKKSTVIIAPNDKLIFSGDTVFHGGIGRSDFPYGDHSTLVRDIKNNVLSYDEDFIIYPGHGAKTTVKREKNNIIYKG